MVRDAIRDTYEHSLPIYTNRCWWHSCCCRCYFHYRNRCVSSDDTYITHNGHIWVRSLFIWLGSVCCFWSHIFFPQNFIICSCKIKRSHDLLCEQCYNPVVLWSFKIRSFPSGLHWPSYGNVCRHSSFRQVWLARSCGAQHGVIRISAFRSVAPRTTL